MRRLVASALVLVSLALITLYFRESDRGGLHEAQRIGLAILRPFEVAGERISRPFRDAYGSVADLFDAKAENARLRARLEQLTQQIVQNRTAAQENERLRALLQYREGDRFPEGYRAVATRVIVRPGNPFRQEVVVAAGSNDGVTEDAPVVTEDGLVGLVTKVFPSASQVTLLTDPTINVSAVDVQTEAAGIVRTAASERSGLLLDRVEKNQVVNQGDTVMTAGWKSGKLESLYPRGLPIGAVTSVGQQDIDLYKRIQLTPFVDFGALSEVLILVQT